MTSPNTIPEKSQEPYFADPLVFSPSLQAAPDDEDDVEQTPRVLSRRNACTRCRRRKMKCNGGLPACANCTRLKTDCVYVESRRKSGLPPGYVRGLETRLAEVEELLRQYESKFKDPTLNIRPDTPTGQLQGQVDDFLDMSIAPSYGNSLPDFQMGFDVPINVETQTPFLLEDLSWSMIGLGLEEPLPPQDAIDELIVMYFTKVHHNIPIIHQYRFLAAMNFSAEARPQVSLQYAMWALAASMTEKYKSFHTLFYSRAKKYIERDETAGRHSYINLRHAQAFVLVGMYEFKHCLFPNTTLTSSRAVRLTQMLNFHRLDGFGLNIKQTLSKPSHMGEKEERRRTFWMAFAMDIHASIGTGWPTIVDEIDILTNLPCSEEKFEASEEGPSLTLKDAMNPRNASQLSSFGGRILVSSLMGRIFHHLHRPSTSTDSDEVNKQFWKSHREIDSTLLNMALFLPQHLRLPFGILDTNVVYLNMSLHTAVICLHQAAMFKAEKLPDGGDIVAESTARCFSAATGITSIMKQIAHLDLGTLSIFTPFSLYLSTRIFAQTARKHPPNESGAAEQNFLLSALMALRDHNPLVDLYLVQLDLEGIGMSNLQKNVQVYPELEKVMSDISVVEHDDESSWMTFVSPLVRIVEQTEENDSPASQVRNTLSELNSDRDKDKNKDAEIGWADTGLDGVTDPMFRQDQSWLPNEEAGTFPNFLSELIGFQS